MSCHHHTEVLLFPFFGDYGIIITLFITGLAGSFAHCIYMCGPIALGIANIRLISSSKTSLTEIERFKIALCLPYYFGKATTYTLLALTSAFLAQKLASIELMRYIFFAFLLLTSIGFIVMGVSRSVNIGISLPPGITNFLSRITKGSSYGVKGFIQGLILGLIPCGLVISSITIAATYSTSYVILALSVFSFGIATVPGLLIVSYCGNYVQYKFRDKTLSFLFAIIMFFNAYILARYALKLI